MPIYYRCSVCGNIANERKQWQGKDRVYTDSCVRCGSKSRPEIIEDDPDHELIKENVRLAKQKQNHQDKNRINNKSFREYARIENAIEEYAKALKYIFETNGSELSKNFPDYSYISPSEEYDGEIGVIQISDTHFNELVDLPHNKYDMRVASHRFYKLAMEAISIFKSRNIKKVSVVFTGDLLNSDRRLDEMLNKATNRSKATFVAVDLIIKFLSHLNLHFDISVNSVLGNESRVTKEMPFSNNVLSDNYDFVIMNAVKLLLKDSGIKFGDMSQTAVILNINGHRVLAKHGFGKKIEKPNDIQSLIGRYHIQQSDIDCVMVGHIHATLIQDYLYRSGSTVGSNSFNEEALNLTSRASQNIYIFGKSYRYSISIDLQNFVDGEWYDIHDSMMEYDSKNNKNHKTKTIMEIVI